MAKQKRQATLAKHFFFVCECERCNKEPHTTDGHKCSRAQCHGTVVISMFVNHGKSTSKLKLYKLGENSKEALCDTCGSSTNPEDLKSLVLQANELLSQAQSLRKGSTSQPLGSN